ncbi:MAG: tRNA uridine-5-carboxymethylaminomethyl(34) synthesis GTPase MnmE [Thermodesulfovibrionales bacterium]|nr:tRNA uridine-5-carboxymethylaminomethyl(34) synthesis GTPase MnmE [Thermodesulfovibrionales bacterium]
MSPDDTIAAVSTPAGEAGIGIVRLSGKDAVDIAERIFSPAGGKSLREAKSHRILYGFIKAPETGEAVDEALVTVMRAPRTYTREDVVEINCHGGYIPLSRVLELTLKHGARLAGPGEFTKRAFLNGRLDLSQAEAVIDLIRAKTDTAERVALEQLRGSLGKRINALREGLLEISSQIEAGIDFPEEEIEPSGIGEIEAGLKRIVSELSAMSKTYEEGRFLREGVRAAIVGKPNVGKSSLLNRLLQRDRAIVTEMPGTTRDVIEEYLNINGLPVRVMDTAGIREAHDMAESEGVRRSLQAIADADIVIALIDGSAPLSGEDMEVIEKIKGKKSITAINKCDLPQAELKLPAGLNPLRLSAKTEEGIEGLKSAIFNSCVKGAAAAAESVIVTNIRHKTAIEGASERLNAALSAISEDRPLEIISLELRDGMNLMAEITGAITTEDILQRIFSAFCVGK